MDTCGYLDQRAGNPTAELILDTALAGHHGLSPNVSPAGPWGMSTVSAETSRSEGQLTTPCTTSAT